MSSLYKSQELRLTQGTFALVALAEPLHDTVGVELLLTGLAAFLGQVALGVDDIVADGALLNTAEFLVDVVLPQDDSVNNGVVLVVQLRL